MCIHAHWMYVRTHRANMTWENDDLFKASRKFESYDLSKYVSGQQRPMFMNMVGPTWVIRLRRHARAMCLADGTTAIARHPVYA